MRYRGLLASLLLLSAFPVSSVLGQVPAEPGDWPQWRGPNRDGISLETGLLKEWPKNGPKQEWQVNTVGIGYSSIAVKGGRIYTQGDIDGVEHVIALDAKDGRTLWTVQPGTLAKVLEDRLTSEFKQLDANSDGTIDEIEALRRLNWDFNRFELALPDGKAEVVQARAKWVFGQLDKDQDGRLTFVEGMPVLRDHFERADAEDKQADAKSLASQRTTTYVKDLDKDSDSQIDRTEARSSAVERFFDRANKKDPATDKPDDRLTVDEIQEYLTKSESGRDGVVVEQELVDYYTRANLSGDGKLTRDELRRVYGGYRNGMGDGPRGTPTLDGERLYVEGGNGDLSCLNAANGETIWQINLRRDFGGGLPGWGYSESPLIVGNLIVVTPGGNKGTVLALDKVSGEKVWQSEGFGEGAHYSSAVLGTIAGTKQIVQFSSGNVFGVSLKDGKLLWKYKAPANGTANCCSPIIADDYVFASSSYGVGGGLTRISGGGENLVAEEVYFDKKIACHHGGIVKVGDFLYSNAGGPLMCNEFLTGDLKWQDRSVGKGSLVVADGMLYLLSESHEMALAEVNPDKYVEHGRFKIQAHGRPSWAHPVVAGGRLYIRDQESLTAYDVRK